MSKEIFKDVVGFEGLYQISNLGNVYSFISERLLKYPKRNKKYYLTHNLIKNNRRHAKSVHRLIAEAFIPNPNCLNSVNHKNGNKQDNSVENLEWCTVQDNNFHALSIGLANNKGSKHGLSKLNEDEVLEIKILLNNKTKSQLEISKLYKVSRQTINDISNNRRWGWL